MTYDDRQVAAAMRQYGALSNHQLADELVWSCELPRRYTRAQRVALQLLAAKRLRERNGDKW